MKLNTARSVILMIYSIAVIMMCLFIPTKITATTYSRYWKSEAQDIPVKIIYYPMFKQYDFKDDRITAMRYIGVPDYSRLRLQIFAFTFIFGTAFVLADKVEEKKCKT